MALFDTYGIENLVVDSPLCVTYTNNRINCNYVGETETTSGNSVTYTEMMEYHRRATKCYRYIAMVESVAKQCRNDVISSYNRNYRISVWDSTTGDDLGLGSFRDWIAGTKLMAEVSMERNADGSWDVIVCVNEDDVRLRKIQFLTSADILFGTERLRDYGGEKEVEF